MNDIKDRLFVLQDKKYKEFQSGLIPGMDKARMIGVRTPDLKRLAKKLGSDETFLNELPHTYFEEDQLHAFMIASVKDFDKAMTEVERFLPYVDNWATCDQLNVRCFSKHKIALKKKIRKWLRSKRTYTIRFAIKQLMDHFLDEDFDPECLEMVADVKNDEYYVRMMKAWFFATALAKRWDETIVYIEERSLDEWTHKKTIQKARESFRISEERKDYLKALR